MFDFIYVEEEILRHPRAERFCRRFPNAVQIPIRHYGEIFNRRSQDFRLQKRRPALILAVKHGRRVLEAPGGYGIGSSRNYYFSHMLNCLYDCRYCFLQGMYQSAHMVVFVNYEDFQSEIDKLASEDTVTSASPENPEVKSVDPRPHFFTGYDCDSLALEGITGFVREFLECFAGHQSRALFELRTKSALIDPLLASPPLDNCVVAYSLTPSAVGKRLEVGVPPLDRRLDSAVNLQERGWPVGLRFDPLIHYDDFVTGYRELFEQVFDRLRPDLLHSVSIGPFRLPRSFYKRMHKLYPEEPLLAFGVEDSNGIYSYTSELSRELSEFCHDELMRYVPEELFFPASPPGARV